MDRIAIDGIEVFAHHGVLPQEREQGQRFLIDVTVELDLTGPAASDDLYDTVDYAALSERVHRAASGGPYDLIERVAGAVLDACFEEHRVRAAEVTVHKPDAPVPVPVRDLSVTLRRERP